MRLTLLRTCKRLYATSPWREVRPPESLRRHLEETAKSVTTRMLAHERMLQELRMEIARCARGGPERVDQLDMLQRTLAHITRRLNAPSPPGAGGADAAAPADTAIAPVVVGGGEKREAGAYISPFPEYISTESPTALNNSLEKLLSVRPSPIALVPKICYNLLASPIAPNAYTFNILMRGLTRLRRNSPAYVLFNALANGGLGPRAKPNEGTVAVLLNLTIKNGDYEGFRKVMKIYWRQKMRGGRTRGQRRRPKAILEAMIHGHARFGNLKMVALGLRALARECPDSPEPSVHVLTSILRLRAEKSDLPGGIRTWNRIMDVDARFSRDGTGEEADLRAFYQMYRLCARCGNEPWKAALIEFARQRGWSEYQISHQPPKVKGVSFRRGNKAPDYFAGRGRPRLEGGSEGNEGKRTLLEALDKARSTPLKEGAKTVALLNGRVFRALRSQPPPPPPPSPPPPPPPPASARTHTWKEIISRHLEFKAHARRVRYATRMKPRKRRGKKKKGDTEEREDEKVTEKASD